MTHAIVQSQSPEEREYARYLDAIETRKRRAATLQADLEALSLALGRCAAEYHARVGTLFVELDRARLAIDEYERRISLLLAAPTSAPEQIEDDIRAEFASQREEVQREAEQSRHYEREFEQEQDRPRLDAAGEAEFVRLYRELARRHHPDLARTEEERRRRQPLMQRVNAAFRARDLTALRALEQEAEADDPAFASRSLGEKLVWAIREVARLDDVIAALEQDLLTAQASDTYTMWQRREAGEEIFEVLEADLRREIAEARDRLAELIATFRQLVSHTHP